MWTIPLPDRESNDHEQANNQRSQHLSTRPRILVSTSLQAHEEESDASNGQECSAIINALDDIHSSQTIDVVTFWWMVAEDDSN